MSVVGVFRAVRDIPYRIPLSSHEQDQCCAGKHGRLFNELRAKGYTARMRTCVFLWNSISLPKELKRIPHEKTSYHSYVEVFLHGKWVRLDATWDKPLQHILPVSEWDGTSDTPIAVKPIKIFSRYEEYPHFEDTIIDDDVKVNGKFYHALNLWLESERKKGE